MTKEELKTGEWYIYNDNYIVFCTEAGTDHIKINKYIDTKGRYCIESATLPISRLEPLSGYKKDSLKTALKERIKENAIKEYLGIANPELIPIYELFMKTLLNE